MKIFHESKKSISLDAIDKKILHHYVHNVRIPINKLAKLVRVSRTTVHYRIAQMQKLGIITGTRAVINVTKLGYSSFHVFSKIQAADQEIIKNATQHNDVNTVISFTGKISLEVSIIAKNPKEVQQVIEQLYSQQSYGSIVCIVETLKSTVLPDAKTYRLSKNNSHKIDLTDLKILSFLSNDATISYEGIAKKLHLTRETIKLRIKKLESSDYILQYRAIINYAALQRGIHVILIKSLVNVKELEMYLANQQNIIWSAKTMGHWQYIVYYTSKTKEDIHAFGTELKNKFYQYVEDLEFLLALEEHKYSFCSERMFEKLS